LLAVLASLAVRCGSGSSAQLDGRPAGVGPVDFSNKKEATVMDKWPIGVFTSIDAGLGVKLEVAHELGVPTIQLHAPASETRTPENAEQFVARLKQLGIELTAVFGGFAGESYADIPTVVRTVGLVPAQTRAVRTREMKEIADFARLLGCDVVALHLGFIPHDTSDPLYAEVLQVTREVCDHVKANGQNLHLETGQESADGLLQFIHDVGRDNLFVNFDPANMILYGTGEPIEALRKIGNYVRSVHCKDGKWAARPGEEWGQEVPLGEGDVGIETYLRTLDELGYTGPLTIEREIPQEPERQKAEIGHAIRLLSELKDKIG
jgi:sugar phosphate isomerase/epimerase